MLKNKGLCCDYKDKERKGAQPIYVIAQDGGIQAILTQELIKLNRLALALWLNRISNFQLTKLTRQKKNFIPNQKLLS